MSLGESIKFSAFIRNEPAMTEPPKDYELTDKDWDDLAKAYDDDYWPPSRRTRDTQVIAVMCLLSAVGGFLIGWTI